jgi:hypothetical protein
MGALKNLRDGGLGLIEDDDDEMMMEGEGERGLIGTHGLQSTRGHVRHADLAQ